MENHYISTESAAGVKPLTVKSLMGMCAAGALFGGSYILALGADREDRLALEHHEISNNQTSPNKAAALLGALNIKAPDSAKLESEVQRIETRSSNFKEFCIAADAKGQDVVKDDPLCKAWAVDLGRIAVRPAESGIETPR